MDFYLPAPTVHNIVQKIGYPTVSPNIEDPSVLKEYYAALAISNISYFDNALAIAKFSAVHEWSALGTPIDRDLWDMSAPTVNVRSRQVSRNDHLTLSGLL